MPHCLGMKGAVAALSVGFSLASFADFATAQTTLDSLRKSGIKHGIANDTPYGYTDPAGKTIGIEVEIAQQIMGKLGVTGYEPVITTFGALIPGVKAKRFDVASDGIYIRAERCRQVLFSDPHLMFGEGIVVKKGNPKKVLSVDDLAKDPTLRIGMTTGGSQHKTFLMAGGKQDQLNDFPDRATLVAALKSNRIDVALLTTMGAVTMYETNKDADFELVDDFKPFYKDGKPVVSYAAFAFRPEDKELGEAFNKELLAMIRTPEYAELMKKYGLKPSMLPPRGATAEEACKE